MNVPNLAEVSRSYRGRAIHKGNMLVVRGPEGNATLDYDAYGCANPNCLRKAGLNQFCSQCMENPGVDTSGAYVRKHEPEDPPTVEASPAASQKVWETKPKAAAERDWKCPTCSEQNLLEDATCFGGCGTSAPWLS